MGTPFDHGIVLSPPLPLKPISAQRAMTHLICRDLDLENVLDRRRGRRNIEPKVGRISAVLLLSYHSGFVAGAVLFADRPVQEVWGRAGGALSSSATPTGI